MASGSAETLVGDTDFKHTMTSLASPVSSPGVSERCGLKSSKKLFRSDRAINDSWADRWDW
jgi:hypothetical protein